MLLTEEINRYLKFLDIHKKHYLNTFEPSIVLNNGEYIGVAIPFHDKQKVYEEFNNIILKTIELQDEQRYYLGVFIKKNIYLDSFTLICEDFVKGDALYRKSIIKNPLTWFNKWKELFGNKSFDKTIYDLLGELICYYYCYKKHDDAYWDGIEYPTYDIQTRDANYEVKTSLMKNDCIIHINSQFQLQENERPTFLFFIRLEKATEGINIIDIINKFDNTRKQNIIDILQSMGYKLESHIFSENYRILEIRKYKIDNNFPVFNIEKLNDPVFKSHFLSMNYTVSLTSLNYDLIDLNFLK